MSHIYPDPVPPPADTRQGMQPQADPMREQQLRPGPPPPPGHVHKFQQFRDGKPPHCLCGAYPGDAPPPLPGEVEATLGYDKGVLPPPGVVRRFYKPVPGLDEPSGPVVIVHFGGLWAWAAEEATAYARFDEKLRAHLAAQESELAALRLCLDETRREAVMRTRLADHRARQSRIEELEWVKAACSSMNSGDWGKLWDRAERLRAQAQVGGGE